MNKAFERWSRRSAHDWQFNISLLETKRYKVWLERQMNRSRHAHMLTCNVATMLTC